MGPLQFRAQDVRARLVAQGLGGIGQDQGAQGFLRGGPREDGGGAGRRSRREEGSREGGRVGEHVRCGAWNVDLQERWTPNSDNGKRC